MDDVISNNLLNLPPPVLLERSQIHKRTNTYIGNFFLCNIKYTGVVPKTQYTKKINTNTQFVYPHQKLFCLCNSHQEIFVQRKFPKNKLCILHNCTSYMAATGCVSTKKLLVQESQDHQKNSDFSSSLPSHQVTIFFPISLQYHIIEYTVALTIIVQLPQHHQQIQDFS